MNRLAVFTPLTITTILPGQEERLRRKGFTCLLTCRELDPELLCPRGLAH